MPDLEQKPKFPNRSTPSLESAGFAAEGNVGAVIGTTVTCGVANTKGAYAELIASTAKKAVAIVVHLTKVVVSARYLVDIATGGAGSEAVLISNISLNDGTITSGQEGFSLLFPVTIPAGTRVSARAQSATAAATICASVSLLEID